MFKCYFNACVLLLISEYVFCQDYHSIGNFALEINKAVERSKYADHSSEEVNTIKDKWRTVIDSATSYAGLNDVTLLADTRLDVDAPLPYNVSAECQNSTTIVLQALTARQQWALRSKTPVLVS